MAGVKFYGSGSVWIPGRGKFVRFEGGEYVTDNVSEIEVLAASFRHDAIKEAKELPVKRGRKPKESIDAIGNS